MEPQSKKAIMSFGVLGLKVAQQRYGALTHMNLNQRDGSLTRANSAENPKVLILPQIAMLVLF